MSHEPELSAHRITDFLHRFHGLDQGFADPYLYTRTGNEAAVHLFNVAAGLDSMILGEWQILDQVRQSIKVARNNSQDALPVSLYRLFHGAVETGLQARSQTGFGETGMDLGEAVAGCAKASLGNLDSARVLIIGAGDIAEMAARAFSQAGVAQITIANRSMERGQHLANQFGARAVFSTDINQEMTQADIIISATGAPFYTITKESVKNSRVHNPDRELFIADLAVPPDVDPQVSTLKNVQSLDIEYIQRSVARFSDTSGNEAAAATAITKEGLHRFNNWLDSLDAGPHILQLQQRAERIRKQELKKSVRKLTGITEDQLAAIDALTRSIVKKLLHEPITALKESAGKYDSQNHTLPSSTE